MKALVGSATADEERLQELTHTREETNKVEDWFMDRINAMLRARIQGYVPQALK